MHGFLWSARGPIVTVGCSQQPSGLWLVSSLVMVVWQHTPQGTLSGMVGLTGHTSRQHCPEALTIMSTGSLCSVVRNIVAASRHRCSPPVTNVTLAFILTSAVHGWQSGQ